MSDGGEATTPSEGQWMLNEVTDVNVLTWAVLGILALIAAFPLFLLWAFLFGGASVLEGSLNTMPVGFLLVLPLLGLHELCHGMAFRAAGASPRYGYKTMNGMPMLYATAPGHWMTRNEYAVVGFAPTVLVSVLGLASMALVPFLRCALVTALSIHLIGCTGDWWIMSKVLRLPRAARCEDLESGFRYRLEATRG